MIKALSRPNKFIICISIILILCIFVEVPIINYTQTAQAIAGVDDLAFLLFIATVLVASGIVLSDQNMWEAFHQAKGKLYSLSKSIYEDLKLRGTLNKPSVLGFTSALRTKLGLGGKQLPVTNNITGATENINVIDQEVSKELLQDMEVGRWVSDVVQNDSTFNLYSTQFDTEAGAANLNGGTLYSTKSLIEQGIICPLVTSQGYLLKSDTVPGTTLNDNVAYQSGEKQIIHHFFVTGEASTIPGLKIRLYGWEKNDTGSDSVTVALSTWQNDIKVTNSSKTSTIVLTQYPQTSYVEVTYETSIRATDKIEMYITTQTTNKTVAIEHGIRGITFSSPVKIASSQEQLQEQVGTSNVVKALNIDQVKPVVIPSTISIPIDAGVIENVAKGTYDVQQVATSAGAVTTGTTIGDTMSVPTTGTGEITFPQTLIDTWENIKTNIQSLVQSLTQVQTETAAPDLTETAKNYNLPDMIILLLIIILACIRLIARFLIFIISLLGIQADDSLLPEIVKRVINFIKSAMIPGFNLSFWNLLESFMVFLFSLKIITFIKGYVGGYYGAIETRDFYADQRNRAFKGR